MGWEECVWLIQDKFNYREIDNVKSLINLTMIVQFCTMVVTIQ